MQLPYGITKVERVYDLGSTPAVCYRNTGVVKVNAKIWDTLTNDYQYFILCHEAGHIVLNTTDEFKADAYAFEQYAKSGRSLTQAVYALSKVLPFNNIEHYGRLQKQYKNALRYDSEVNNNYKATQLLNKMDNMTATEIEQSFLGLGKQAKANRQTKFDMKMDRKAARTEVINSRADKKKNIGLAKLERAEAEKSLAEQGITSKTPLDTVANTVGRVLGGGGGDGGEGARETAPGADAPAPTDEKKILGMKPTTAYIVIASVVATVAGLAWYFLKKK